MHPHLTKLKRVISRLATVDQTEVCPLSRGMMSQPLSEPLQPSLFPSSHTRMINNVPYGPSANRTALATIRAYHVPGMSHD